MKKITNDIQALEEALAIFRPTTITYNYRIYYDPITNNCIEKTIEDRDGQYIEVDKDTYHNMGSVENYNVIDNKLVEKKPKQLKSIHLKLTTDVTSFKVLKNHKEFLLTKNSKLPHDYWTHNYE